MAAQMLRRRYVVRGTVQGLGYRWFARDLADGLSVVGWVRNREDGSVEIEAQSSTETLTAFEDELRTGHPTARVKELQVQEMPPLELEQGFRILT